MSSTVKRRTRSEEIHPLVPRRPSKFRNVGTMVDDIWFHSKAEAVRFSELRFLEKAGLITGLTLQPSYPLSIDGVVLGKAVFDFRYVEAGRGTVIEDKKGYDNPMSRWKRKHFEAQYKLKVLVT